VKFVGNAKLTYIFLSVSNNLKVIWEIFCNYRCDG